MKAAIYHGPKDIRCQTIDDAKITQRHEILVRVKATSICGSDLHVYRGAFEGLMTEGLSQTGHELCGEVVEVGSDVSKFRPGDTVTMAYSCSCGDCYMCQIGQTAHCETTNKAVYGFGAPFGNLNGTHADAVVLPYAEAHTLKIPDGVSDVAALTLSCNLPTAIIANRLADVAPGELIAIVGCGPTGLMAMDLAILRGPGAVVALDPVPHRRATAIKRGAVAFDPTHDGWKEEALAITNGRGFDKVIEIVGSSTSLQMALDLVRAGGTVAAMGVFPETEFNLVLADVFLRDISLHMNGFANVQPYMREGLRLLERGVVDTEQYFSHTFGLEQIGAAYDTFFTKSDGALKVVIRP